MSGPLAPSELHRLAQCLADPGFRPIYLNKDNANEGRARSLAEAWASNRPFCTQVRHDVIPVDVDQRQVPLLPRFQDAIAASEHPFLEIASSGLDEPNRHFFIWVPEALGREQLLETLRSIGGREPIRHGQAMRLPGVLHRRGIARSEPIDVNQCRAFLQKVDERHGRVVDRLEARLSSGTRRLLDDGPGGDRSTWDMAVTHRLLADGLSPDEIVRFGLDGSARFSEKARQREHRRIGSGESYLRLGVNKAVAGRNVGSLGIRSREDAVQLLNETAVAVATADHRLLGGLTARRVLEACIQLYLEQSTFERPLAVRTVAEQAQVDKSTAARWLHHLADIRCLNKTTAARYGGAAVYHLQTPRLRTLLGSQGGCEPKSVLTSGVSGTSLFRYQYGTESGSRSVRALSDLGGEARTGEIADLSHLPRKHIGSVLNRLSDLGIVKRVRHGTWRLTDEDHDFLAELWGANLVEKRQKARHELDKVGYGIYRLNRLEHQLGERLTHLSVLDSNTVVNLDTGETITIDDLWKDPQRARSGADQ